MVPSFLVKKRQTKNHMQLLPPELNCLIVELSSGSPNSLADLARTHSAYQREAEKALYGTISIHTSSDNSLKCMETLVTNSEKAAFVRSLTIEYARSNTNRKRRVTTYLSKSLINMCSLSDFRVLSPFEDFQSAQMMKSLVKILWSVSKNLIFSKLTILLAKQSRSFSITNYSLPRSSQHF